MTQTVKAVHFYLVALDIGVHKLAQQFGLALPVHTVKLQQVGRFFRFLSRT